MGIFSTLEGMYTLNLHMTSTENKLMYVVLLVEKS